MKNFSVKKSLAIMVAAAGFSSLFLVMNSAFGLDAPVTDPDDAAGISPTFKGVTLTDDLVFENGGRITRGADAFGTYISFEDANTYGVNGTLTTSLLVGQIQGGQGITITPTAISRSGGNLGINAPGADVSVSANNLRVTGNVNVTGSVVASGGMDLPFRTSSAVIAGNAAATYPTQLVACPGGTTKVVSCQLYFSLGNNLITGPGTRNRTDGVAGCSGRYYQTGAGNTSGVLTATCL